MRMRTMKEHGFAIGAPVFVVTNVAQMPAVVTASTVDGEYDVWLIDERCPMFELTARELAPRQPDDVTTKY